MRTYFLLLPAATLFLMSCGDKSKSAQSATATDSIAVLQEAEPAELVSDNASDMSWSSPNMPLPVSKKQLVHDWAIAAQEGYLEEEPPFRYKCMDLDLDGNPEVLLLGESMTGGPRAILTYLDGKFRDYSYASDGYDTYSISKPCKGKAVFVSEHDDHMHTDRNLSTYYHTISNGVLKMVATAYHSIMYNEETGEYDGSEDTSEVPQELLETTVYDFSDLENWVLLDLSDEEKAVMSEVESKDNFLFNSLVEGSLYRGTIGKYPITLSLFPSDNPIGSIYAQYWYESNPTSVFRLMAEGETSVENGSDGTLKINLTEYAPNGNQSGTLVAVHDIRNHTIKGTFTNSKGQTFSTSLTQVQF